MWCVAAYMHLNVNGLMYACGDVSMQMSQQLVKTHCCCACRGAPRCMTQSSALGWTRATSRSGSWM
jgi:hypothetical protein